MSPATRDPGGPLTSPTLTRAKPGGEWPPPRPAGTLVHRAGRPGRPPPRQPMVPPGEDLRHWPGPGRGTRLDLPEGNSWAVITMIEVTAEALATHPFLHGMPRDHLAVLAGTARDVTFPARHRLFEDGGSAARFWLIQSGHVTLDLNVPGQSRMKLDTIGMGELLGWSWLFPPYRWAFGAAAARRVEAFEFDARAVRACCETDPVL